MSDLSLHTDSSGRTRVRIRTEQGNKTAAIHRLNYVAEYGFDRLPKDGKVIHKNGITWINSPENLIAERERPLSIRTTKEERREGGAEIFRDDTGDGADMVYYHRLLWVAEHGLDVLSPDDIVTQENGIRWDNRPANLIKKGQESKFDTPDSETEIRVATHPKGHTRIRVPEGESYESFAVHRLVYAAEHGLEKLAEAGRVIHKDQPKWVNAPENLQSKKKRPVRMRTSTGGHEEFCDYSGDGSVDLVAHHRLLYVAENGMNALSANEDLTHKNGIRWDNRPENIARQRSQPPELRIDSNGYEYFCCYVNDRHHKVYQHRLLYVARNGLNALDADEVVHHKNHLPWDNRIGNLEAKSADDHREYHVQQHYADTELAASGFIDDRDVVADGGRQNVREFIQNECTSGDTLRIPRVAGNVGVSPESAKRMLNALCGELVEATDDGFRVL